MKISLVPELAPESMYVFDIPVQRHNQVLNYLNNHRAMLVKGLPQVTQVHSLVPEDRNTLTLLCSVERNRKTQKLTFYVAEVQ